MTNIFSRFRDIITSNINAMLDRAEDPEKLVKLMITEMEDTLVEIKVNCAGAMADKKRVQRSLEESRDRARAWYDRAEMAIQKGREDLAREALLERKRLMEWIPALEAEETEFQALIDQYKSEISQLEEKLTTARDQQKVLVQRHIHAQGKKRAQKEIRRFDTSEAMLRFEQFLRKIERMEAEADLVNYRRSSTEKDDPFTVWETDEELEKELKELKRKTSSDQG